MKLKKIVSKAKNSIILLKADIVRTKTSEISCSQLLMQPKISSVHKKSLLYCLIQRCHTPKTLIARYLYVFNVVKTISYKAFHVSKP